MSAVDERVVEMRFDNKQFEKNIKDSIKSLDDLDRQLGVLEDNESFENIEKSTKKLNFSNLADGVGEIGEKFKWLETIAVGALLTIGGKLANLATEYGGFLTLKQINAGWNKFGEVTKTTLTTIAATEDSWEEEATTVARIDALAERMGDRGEAESFWNSIKDVPDETKKLEALRKQLKMTEEDFYDLWQTAWQTENQLTHEEYVDSYIKKLNWYSDETSYNLTDMTSSISKLVGAGEELGAATTEITGFMNMVAKAGGDAQVGIRASRQFIQAMSKGTMQLQDWRSLEDANVANADFRQALIDTAVAMDKLTESIDKNGNVVYKTKGRNAKTFTAEMGFDETLALGWMDSRVMGNTLIEYGKFSDGLYDIVKKNEKYGVDATNTLQMIDMYYETLGDDVDQKKIESFNKEIQKIFGDDKESADEYVKTLELLGSKSYEFSRTAFEAGQEARTFKDSIDATADAVSTKWSMIFESMFGNASVAKDFWTNFTGTLYEIFVSPLNDIIALFTRVKENANVFDDGEIIDGFEAFRRSLNNLQDAVLSIIDPIREAFGNVFLSSAVDNINSLSQSFLNFTKRLIIGEEGTEKIHTIFTVLFSVLKGITVVLRNVFKIIKPIFGIIVPIARLIGTIVSSIFSLIGALLGIDAASENNGFIAFCENASEAVGNAVNFISGALDALTDWIAKHINLEEAQKKFQDLKNVLVKVWGDIKKAVSGAWDKIKEFLHIDDITAAVNSFWQTVKGFLPSWEELLAGLQAGWEIFKQVGMAIWNFISPYLTQLWNSLKTLWSRISIFIDGFLKAENKWRYIKDNVSGIVEAFLEWKRNSKFVNFIIKSFEKLKDVLQKVKDALSPKDDSKGSAAGRFMGILYLASSLTALFLVLKNVDRIVGGFTDITKAIKKFSKFLNKAALFVGMYLIIKAISGLINVLTDFAQLKPEQIAAGVGSILVILAGLAIFATHIKKITEGLSEKKLRNFKQTCLSMTLVLLAVAASMWVLAKAPGSNASLLQRVIMMLIPLAAILGMVYVLSKIPGGIDLKSLGAIVVIAGVLFVAALAIDKLAKIPEDALAQAQKLLLALAGAVVVAMLIGNFLKNGAGAIKNIGIAVAAMAAAFLLIVLALSKLQGVTFDMGTVALILGIVGILGVLAAIPVAMNRFLNHDQMSPKNMLKMASIVGVMTACLVVVALSLGLLVSGMKKAQATPGDIIAVGVTLGVIMICLGIMAVVLAKATKAASTEKGNTMKQTAKAVRSMVVSLLLIVGAIVVLTKLNVNANDMKDALKIIIEAAAVIVGMVAAMAFASSLAKNNKISSGPIIAAVIGIIAVIGTMMILSKFLQKGNDLSGAFDVVLEVSLVLALLVAIMAGAQKFAGGNVQWAPILVIVLGIIAIMKTMMLMTAFAGDALTQVTEVLFAIAIALGALIFVASFLQNSSGGWSKTLQSVLMIAAVVGALVAMAFVMKQLQGVEVPWQTIEQIVVALGLLGALFGLIGIIAGDSGLGSVGLLAVSVMIIALAAAIGILAIAINIAVLALPAFAAGMQKVFDVIGGITASNDQLEAFARILGVLAIAGTVAMIGMGVGALIMAAGFYVGAQALAIVSGILPELSEGLLRLVTTLGMIAPVMGPVLGAAGKLVLVFLALMVGGIMLGAGLAVAGIGLGIVGGAAMILATAIGIASLAVSALVLSFALLAEGIARVVDLFKGGNLTEEVSAFSDSVKSSTGEITSSVGEMKASLAEEGGINLTDFLNFGGANGDSMLSKDSLMSGIGDLFGGGDIQNMFSGGLTDSLTGAMGDLDMTSIMGPLGEQMGGFDFTTIMADSGAGDSLVTGLFSGVTEEGMEAPANELAEDFADTLGSSSNKSKTKSAGGALGQSGSSGASATHGMWYSSGTYVAQGLIDGVASKIKASDLIGTKLANALIEACREQLKERSPSRVFYGIGEYVVEGLANGISDNTDVAVTSVEGMAKDSIAAATEALAAAIENDYSSPVIAPVLDLSNIAEGASRINSMFGNNRIGVDGEIQNGENRASGVTYNYTQNNYSPKALSRIEIYRQTRNQLSTISV